MNASLSTRAIGDRAENSARRHLEYHGLNLITRNYRSPFGEIDLIMRDGDTFVFVEVRSRAREAFGSAAETVDARKRARLRATAEHYLQHDRRAGAAPCRFDIVAITHAPDDERIVWLRDAF